MPLTTSTELLKSRPICPVERDLETLKHHKFSYKFIYNLVPIIFSECHKFFVHFDSEKVTKIIRLVTMDKIQATRYGSTITVFFHSLWLMDHDSWSMSHGVSIIELSNSARAKYGSWELKRRWNLFNSVTKYKKWSKSYWTRLSFERLGEWNSCIWKNYC